jgi:glycerol-1-phosphate dehydrogenase [NAD(P)+]
MNEEVHIINLTRRVVIGRDVIKRIVDYFPEPLSRNYNKAFIVTGPHVWGLHGKKLEEALERHGYSIEVYKAKDSHIETARTIADEAARYGSGILIGFGGGKSIDLAKYAAKIINKPFISVPTAASHDGIGSPFASLKGRDTSISVKTVEPMLIVADTNVISTSPRRLLIAGAGDLIAKFTAVLDWRLAHLLRNEYYGEYAASLALLSAKHIVRYKDIIAKTKVQGTRIVLEALISSSMSMGIAGSTRPASGSEHLFSHALDMIAPKPALHGEQTAVGTILMAKLHRINWKKIKKVLHDIGAPTTAKDLGIPDEIIIKALTIAHKIRPERYTILGDKGLTWEAAERLARETGVIS